jgi:hypothetical protein
MSQAGKPNTTNPSRRTALAGLFTAAAGAAALPAFAGTGVEPDPIYAAIERHRAAWHEFNSRCSALNDAGTPESLAEERRLMDAHQQAADDMVDTTPTTIAGVITLLRYAAEVQERDLGMVVVEENDPRLLHSVADALEEMAGQLGLSLAAAGVALPIAAADVDPIFALIAEHAAAAKARETAVNAEGTFTSDCPEYEAAGAASRAAWAHDHDILSKLLRAEPTTLAGVAALLTHVSLPEFPDEADEYPDCSRTHLTTGLDCGPALKKIAEDFPGRLAKTMRSLIEVQS